jgi:hypothetical protein
LCDAEGFAAGVDVAREWVGVARVEEDGGVMGAGDGSGGTIGCLALGLEGREVTIVWEREEEGPVERKRPSSSSKGVGSTIDLPEVSGDLADCESNPK